MKKLLHRKSLYYLMFLILSSFLSNQAIGQSCSENNIGFNGIESSNSLNLCATTAGTTIDGSAPAGSPVYQWQVSTTVISGPFSTVSPDPGNVEDWTISATYYNTPGNYYFRRVVTNTASCNGNSDVVTLSVKSIPTVTNNGGGSGGCGPSGFIILYGSNGITPYTYSLDGVTFQAGNTFNNLAAGTYTGYVKDFFGCVGSKSNIVITEAAPIVVTANPKQASACADNGSIELYRTGGISSFTYSLDNITYQVSNTFTGLAGGTYTGWVKDSKGCTGSLGGIVVTKAAVLTITHTKSNTSSCGTTGFIQLFPGGGTAGYTYSLNDITYQAASTFTGLAAGTYTGWAKDAKGCKVSEPGIIIGTDPGTSINVTSFARTTSSCANTGSIELYRSGGVSPFTYSLDDISYQSSNTFSGLAAGTYTGWVKDIYGCKGFQTGISITASAAVTVSGTHINTSTCVNDGSISLTASNGVAPFTYSKDDITYQSGSTLTGLGAGNYTAWVKDANGCKASVNKTIGLNQVVVTAYAAASSNCAASNGSIQLFRTGGVGPFTYSLNGVSYQSSNSFTGLAPGSYTGYVKDAKTCVGTLANIVVASSNATISLSSATGTDAQTICNNASVVSISYIVGGGGTGANVTGLPAGVTGNFAAGVFSISGTATVSGVFNYTVTTTGSCNQVSANGTITILAGPNATFTKTMASSCGSGNDGTITVSVSGGTAPYSFSWTGTGGFNSASQSVTGLSTGDYTIVVTDANGCTKTIPDISIWQAQTPYMTYSASNTSSCANDAFITLYPIYGIAPYTYSLDAVTYQSSNIFSTLPAGTYTGYVKDMMGCIGTRQIIIGTSAPVSVTSYAWSATACGANDGKIQLFRTGGVSNYTYSLNGVTFFTSPLFTGLARGYYTGYVKDSKGCIGTQTGIFVGPDCSRPGTVNKNAGSNEEIAVEKSGLNVQVYPNPSATEFSVITNAGSNAKATITVKDIFGRIVFQSQSGNKIPTRFGNNFIPGFYVVEVMQGKEKQSRKIIKE